MGGSHPSNASNALRFIVTSKYLNLILAKPLTLFHTGGEGCGVIILKRLDDAVRDGDTIRAVIRGSGVNSDGWTQGVTMPSSEAQAALIQYVYESQRLDYDSTQYVEFHGTGTVCKSWGHHTRPT